MRDLIVVKELASLSKALFLTSAHDINTVINRLLVKEFNHSVICLAATHVECSVNVANNDRCYASLCDLYLNSLTSGWRWWKGITSSGILSWLWRWGNRRRLGRLSCWRRRWAGRLLSTCWWDWRYWLVPRWRRRRRRRVSAVIFWHRRLVLIDWRTKDLRLHVLQIKRVRHWTLRGVNPYFLAPLTNTVLTALAKRVIEAKPRHSRKRSLVVLRHCGLAAATKFCVSESKILVVAPNDFSRDVLSNKVKKRSNAIVSGECSANLCGALIHVKRNTNVLWLNAKDCADLSSKVDLPLHELHVAVGGAKRSPLYALTATNDGYLSLP